MVAVCVGAWAFLFNAENTEGAEKAEEDWGRLQF
jgi:hypothetical protein